MCFFGGEERGGGGGFVLIFSRLERGLEKRKQIRRREMRKKSKEERIKMGDEELTGKVLAVHVLGLRYGR